MHLLAGAALLLLAAAPQPADGKKATKAGIYPADHWDHSTALTKGGFNDWIRAEVDSGRTAVVRWIASEG